MPRVKTILKGEVDHVDVWIIAHSTYLHMYTDGYKGSWCFLMNGLLSIGSLLNGWLLYCKSIKALNTLQRTHLSMPDKAQQLATMKEQTLYIVVCMRQLHSKPISTNSSSPCTALKWCTSLFCVSSCSRGLRLSRAALRAWHNHFNEMNLMSTKHWVANTLVYREFLLYGAEGAPATFVFSKVNCWP